ncbi:hypothetical protein QL285_014632 [Trifolium repens]|nr:hypothetical protein QL285_014632 [Trifolium repens]
MIIAHTIFGKSVNNTAVSREEHFMMFYVFQSRPINAATFLLANFAKIIEDTTRRISIGDFVTFLARAIDLHTPLSRIVLSGGIQPMDITFCFNNHLIGNLGPDQFQLLINFKSVHHFTMSNSDRTSVHDKQNCLYDFEGQDETDPEIPPSLYYYTPGPATPPFRLLLQPSHHLRLTMVLLSPVYGPSSLHFAQTSITLWTSSLRSSIIVQSRSWVSDSTFLS